MNVASWSLVTALIAVVQMLTAYAQLYQGDIVLTDSQMHSVEAHANQHSLFAPQDAVVKNRRQLWPNAVVPYIIDNSLGKLLLIFVIVYLSYLSITMIIL